MQNQTKIIIIFFLIKEINAVKMIQREWRRYREDKDDNKTNEVKNDQENENV